MKNQHSSKKVNDLLDACAGPVELGEEQLNQVQGAWTPAITIAVTEAGNCFTINETVCNGTCKAWTNGCC